VLSDINCSNRALGPACCAWPGAGGAWPSGQSNRPRAACVSRSARAGPCAKLAWAVNRGCDLHYLFRPAQVDSQIESLTVAGRKTKAAGVKGLAQMLAGSNGLRPKEMRFYCSSKDGPTVVNALSSLSLERSALARLEKLTLNSIYHDKRCPCFCWEVLPVRWVR
jgi:hypothetical protein